MVETLRNVMSYGYPPSQNYTSSSSQTNKLYHQEYRTDTRPSWHTRPPPPNYGSSQFGSVAPNVSPPSPPPALTPHPAEATSVISSGCMCISCNRPPQYHLPSLPHPPLPHYSSQPPWHHQQQSFGSPVGSASGGAHNEFQNTPWSPGMAMTAYERNNNEPSMVPPNRYAQMQDPGRYATTQESSRYSSIPDSSRYTQSHDTNRHTPVHDTVPPDPREWTALDVQRWIQWASYSYKLKIIPSDRFQMNGKALCLMDLSMFMFRVPDGGERLYDDFQTRLKKALCQDQPPKIT